MAGWRRYRADMAVPSVMRFDWDQHNLQKCTARAPRGEIESLFADPDLMVGPANSDKETRYRALGHTDAKRAMVVIFTIRVMDRDLHIRPVSARYAHAKEAKTWPKPKPSPAT